MIDEKTYVKRVVIAGCRDYKNYEQAKEFIDLCLLEIKNQDEVVIVSGGASGADAIGERYAKENGIKYSVLLERLKMICKSQLISNALKDYPWYRLPKKQAAFAFAMKYKLYFLQKLMVLFRAR